MHGLVFMGAYRQLFLQNCVYVAVNFLSQIIFIFLLLLSMVMYAYEVETKEK